MRFLPIGLHAVLVELADLDETLALYATLGKAPLPDIAEIVPGARTLLIRLHPHAHADLEALAAELRSRDLSEGRAVSDQQVTIPVLYDGEDLDEVARLTGLSAHEVVARHNSSVFTVAFTGFAPGFAYLTGGDPQLFVPRRTSPRTKIPAGSVALAGAFSGVYPKASPGGWQIIGTTPLEMFDLARSPSALLQPGAQVRFEALADRAAYEALRTSSPHEQKAEPASNDGTSLAVTAAPFPALWQDGGRSGLVSQGISTSGALDRGALRLANEIVGNGPGEPCLEITGGGFAFTADGPAVLALIGAPSEMEITTADGSLLRFHAGQAVAINEGDRIGIVASLSGMCSYLAARGGFVVEPVLGSAARDTLAQLGPEPVRAGATISIRKRHGGLAVRPEPISLPALPRPGDVVEIDIVMGPRTQWFTAGAIERLTSAEWIVTPQSNRVGLRLNGDVPLERVEPEAELPSEGTIRGAIQVPHNGQPIVFLADHPLTIGYPVIAAIAEHHLDLVAQAPAGARLRFRALGPFAEIAPQATGMTS